MSGGDGVGAGVGVTMLVAQGEGRSPGHGFKSPQPDHVGSSQVKTRNENVQNQNSGSAATDTLLWRIGVSCHNLTRLVIGGTEVHGKINGSVEDVNFQVTDQGLHWLCGQQCPNSELSAPVR